MPAFKIYLQSMNYKREYKYEINPQMNHFVFTPTTERAIHKILMALSMH